VILMADHPGREISHTRELWLRNGRIISQAKQRHRRQGNVFEDSLVKCIIGPSTAMIGRSLYVESGGFRDDIEIGEDYEYWLRLTPRCDVGYVDLPLTVKRAGHSDQLSVKYGRIEYFRINALKGLVDGNFFDGANLGMARQELARKCAIYAQGARKRGKEGEACGYDELSSAYSDGS